MDKIKMTTPLVEMDGDEMTRILWKMIKDELPFANDDYIFIPGIRKAIQDKLTDIPAYVVGKEMKPITLKMGELTDDERKIILAGCLINYYKES